MVKSHVIIRRTMVPSVVEVEVTQPQGMAHPIPLDRLLERHRVRRLASYVFDTRDRVMLRAKGISRDGAPIGQVDMAGLLEDLRGVVIGGVADRGRAA
jgi:hypothetical protein